MSMTITILRYTCAFPYCESLRYGVKYTISQYQERINMEYDKEKPIFPISIASKMVGVTTKMLRIYEEQGLLSPSRTDDTQKIRGRRLYSEKDIEYVKCLRALMKQGFTLDNLKIIYEFSQSPKAKNLKNKEDFYTALKTFL